MRIACPDMPPPPPRILFQNLCYFHDVTVFVLFQQLWNLFPIGIGIMLVYGTSNYSLLHFIQRVSLRKKNQEILEAHNLGTLESKTKMFVVYDLAYFIYEKGWSWNIVGITCWILKMRLFWMLVTWLSDHLLYHSNYVYCF